MGWPRRRAAAVLLLFGALAGCDGDAAARAVGVYDLDKDATEQHYRSKSSSGAWGVGVSALRQMVESVQGSFELAPEGAYTRQLSVLGARHEERGSWQLDGEKLRVRGEHGNGDVFRLRDGVITTEQNLGGMEIVLFFRRRP